MSNLEAVGRQRGVGAVWGLRRQTPRSWVNSVWLHFQGYPWDTRCPVSDQTGTAELPADHARGLARLDRSLAVNRKGSCTPLSF